MQISLNAKQQPSHPVRGRYAPSPTGYLHLGNASTALLSWLHVRSQGGQFVLRVEDLDQTRCKPQFETSLYCDLKWLGIDWDEGPDVGGPFAPYRQSLRTENYVHALRQLSTFECVCSRKQIAAIARTNRWGEKVYPGTCRNRLQNAGTSTVTRWHTPQGEVVVADRIWGHLREHVHKEVGEFVLRRRDRVWAYQLAVVVDDAAMGISHIVRGADLLGNTPRQVLLQRNLGLPTPQYSHVPLLTNKNGHKLSKGRQAPSLKAMREAGYAPEQVIAKIACLLGLGSYKSISAKELIQDFDLQKLKPQEYDASDV